MEASVLLIFLPTFLAVSATPGLCMTLSMTLGMTIGLRRTLWMMAGELVGVGLVAVLSVMGVATLMLQYPQAFVLFKGLGGGYLVFLGVQLWRSRGKMAISHARTGSLRATGSELMTQGFVTAVANPKGWAFFVSLLPPFINDQQPLLPQISILVTMILMIELLCLLLYAGGGQTLSRFLTHSGNVRLMNRVAGTLMIAVGGWLAVG